MSRNKWIAPRRDGIADRLGVRPRVKGRDLHGRGRDLGVLRHRQREHGHPPRQHEDQGEEGADRLAATKTRSTVLLFQEIRLFS
jgi:hypothetical protein